MEKANCISCTSTIIIPGVVKLGRMVTCPECGIDLEVVELDPLELDWPYINDWEDEQEAEYDFDEDYWP